MTPPNPLETKQDTPWWYDALVALVEDNGSIETAGEWIVAEARRLAIEEAKEIVKKEMDNNQELFIRETDYAVGERFRWAAHTASVILSRLQSL